MELAPTNEQASKANCVRFSTSGSQTGNVTMARLRASSEGNESGY